MLTEDYRKSRLAKCRPHLVYADLGSSVRTPDPAKRVDLSDLQAFFNLCMPVNPVTCVRQSAVDVLTDSKVDISVKNAIERTLSELPSQNVGEEMSVSDMLSLLPSRYAQAFGDVDSYLKFANEFISKKAQVESGSSSSGSSDPNGEE